MIHLVGLQICLELIPVSIGEAVHDRVGTGGLDALVDIGKQVGDLLGVVRGHQHVRENVLGVHVGRVDVLDPVKTVLGVVRAGDIHAVVADTP